MSKKRQLTKEEAIKLNESKFWKEMSYEARALFQLITDRLCMPPDIFHEAVSKALGRPVWICELALSRQGLIDDLLGKKEPPTFEEIINLIPEEKRIIVTLE